MTKQKPLAPRWANDHTKELNKYFVQGAFDPKNTATSYIDECYLQINDGNILKDIPDNRFRIHYRDKSATFLTEQALSGIRLGELSLMF